MTSFGWRKDTKKRKLDLPESTASCFAQDDSHTERDDDAATVDWLCNQSLKRKILPLEDSIAKAKRLNEEGSLLASDGRYWEAITKFDESLGLTGDDSRVLEMKAQALAELRELYPAVRTAEQSVQSDRKWWVARQTLGRALLNMGELKSAIISFQKAIHLQPDCEELWKDDLNWTMECLNYQNKCQVSDSQDLNFRLRESARAQAIGDLSPTD